MSAKHGHGFRLDTPGTDSWQHRHEGGAERVALVGPEDLAIVGGWAGTGELPLPEVVARFLSDADIVIAEGFKTAAYPKIEVFRSEVAARPLMQGGDPTDEPPSHHRSAQPVGPYLALVSDDPSIAVEVDVLDLAAPDTIARLADRIEGMRG
jgi:molybdopterin-guanine dinucleotide biosynthesis protein MobB